jgi:hypothetical protein
LSSKNNIRGGEEERRIRTKIFKIFIFKEIKTNKNNALLDSCANEAVEEFSNPVAA